MPENGSLADLPGVWGRQRPKFQSLPATCAAGGAKPEVSQSASQTDLVESEIQASRRRGDFRGREPVDQSEKSYFADLRLETLWVSKFSALRKTADSSNRRFEVQRRPTGNRLRFQANLRGMY